MFNIDSQNSLDSSNAVLGFGGENSVSARVGKSRATTRIRSVQLEDLYTAEAVTPRGAAEVKTQWRVEAAAEKA